MSTSLLEPHVTCKVSSQKYPTGAPYPQSRTKHASCVHENYVYLYAGKDRNYSLKDFWRFNTGTQKWETVSLRGDMPQHLEGHTLVSCKKLLLMFGGQFGDSLTESSLWIVNPDLGYIRQFTPDSGSERPCIRRNHSAVVHDGAMYIYGGYIDIKGSSSELWKYHIDDEEWELLSPRQHSRDLPGGRHGHSAVVYNKHIWLYGGSNDLTAKQDFWSYSFGVNRWTRVRYKYGPPALSGHTATVVGSRMLLFGGECNREPVNQLWCYCFKTSRWSQILLQDEIPPRIGHSAIFISPSNQDSAVKASSMPYLQKKMARMHLERPRSSPGQRPNSSGSARRLEQSEHQRSLDSQQSESSKRLDELFQVSESLKSEGNQRPQILSIHSTESLKIEPSPSENTADKSPLCPKKTDINYNAVNALDRNNVLKGFDNPGISKSTEELIEENRRRRFQVEYENMDYINSIPAFERSQSCADSELKHSNTDLYLERSISDLQGQESFLVKNNSEHGYIRPKKSRLDPDLVLEDIENMDSCLTDVQIPYPKYCRMDNAFSSSALVLDSEDVETIVLNDVSQRSRSKSAGEAYTEVDRNRFGKNSEKINESVHYNKQTEQVCLYNESNLRTWEDSKNKENTEKSQFLSKANCLHVNSEISSVRECGVKDGHASCDQNSWQQTGSGDVCTETRFHNGVTQPRNCQPQSSERLYRKNMAPSSSKCPKMSSILQVSKCVEQPYILVIGGKDNKTVNFGTKPIPLWKLQISPL